MTAQFIELYPQRIPKSRLIIQDNSLQDSRAPRFQADGVMLRDEIIFATYQRQALNGTHRLPIDADTHRLRALHECSVFILILKIQSPRH